MSSPPLTAPPPCRPLSPASKIDVVCKGDPFLMGCQQGLALRRKIHAARRALAHLEAFRLQQPLWLPYPLYLLMAERKALHFLNTALTRHNPDMLARLKGLAKGAELDLQAIALFNALEPVLSSVAGCTACPGACSAVAIRGSRSATGEPIIARNFDYLPLVQPFYTMRDCQPDGLFRSFEFTSAPLAGAVDGLNEKGLCITYNYSYTTDEPPEPAPPISMAIAGALARCSTVTEAAQYISDQPRYGGAILMLADAAGDLASLELSSTRSYLRRPAPGEDLLCHSNAFTHPSMHEVQVNWDAVFTRAAPQPLRGKRLHESAQRRDARYQELLREVTPLDSKALNAIMADHGPDNQPGEYTPCVHSEYWYTTACLQLFPQSRRMLVSYSTACRASFDELVMDDSPH